jgi:hypothetical protein
VRAASRRAQRRLHRSADPVAAATALRAPSPTDNELMLRPQRSEADGQRS